MQTNGKKIAYGKASQGFFIRKKVDDSGNIIFKEIAVSMYVDE